MVRTQPDITEGQCPKVQYGEAVGKYRTPHLLGNEVIHDAQEAAGQVETHCVMPPPPLDHRVLYAGKDGKGIGQADRNCHAVHHMQIGDHDDHAHGEPVGHIDMRSLAYRHRHDMVQAERQPDYGDQDIHYPG